MKAALLSLLILLFSSTARAATPEAWLDDFRQLLAEMSSHYANLDSAMNDRRLDLADLRKTAETRIAAAKNDAEAREAIDWFLRQFGDGHVSLDWPSATTSETAAAKPRPLCERLGYARREPGGIDFSTIEGFTRVDDGDSRYFPAGLLQLSAKRKLGIVRVHLFMETAHPELCTQAQQSLHLADDAECDGYCGYRIGGLAANLLTTALERRIESLGRAGATALVIDITGNGGGSDWVEPAARVLSPVPLRAPRLSFLRHPHWSGHLRQRLEDLEADLRDGVEPRSLLEQAAMTIRSAIDEANRPCDRSGLWNDPPAKPDCSLVVPGRLHSTGILPYAKPGAFPESLRSRTILFLPSRYVYREGVNRLPLFVLVDGGTASAAELFAAMLRDNHAARLVGTSTLGSGCGYTDGGVQATLRHSGGRLKLPDCIRLRADGSNEVLGIAPDTLVSWRSRDSRHQRAMKTVRVLESLVK